MYLKGIAIVCLAIVHVSLCYDDIDSFMTKRQIREVFETEAGSVPEHEIVEINMSERQKRDLPFVRTRITLQAFGEDVIELWLHPTEKVLLGANTPVYWANSDLSKPGKVAFYQVNDAMSRIGQLLEDPDTLTSLVMGTDNFGRSTIDGHIAKRGLSIKSLPHDVVTEYLRSRRSINNYDSSSNSTFHVIYKTNEHFGQNNPMIDIDQKMFHERMARSTVQIPSVLYPEILVYVENSMYEAYGSTIPLLKYLAVFWNGVDLKYRTLENPKLRFHISGIIIGRDSGATPYISKNMISEKTINTYGSIAASYPFFYAIKESFPLTSYDITVTLTRHTLVGALGVAYRAGACNNHDGKMYGVALVTDDGAFKGVHTTAHELGHSLGMKIHDNDTMNCLRTDGYIMGWAPWYSKNSSSFSPCTIQEFENHINNQKLTCLYNVPQSLGNDLPKILPGKITNLAAQCQARGLGPPCDLDAVDVCVNFSCMHPDGGCGESGRAALDGTPCGYGTSGTDKFCLHNRCVHFPTPPPPTQPPTRSPPQGRFQIYDRL